MVITFNPTAPAKEQIVFKTRVIQKTLNPYWGERFMAYGSPPYFSCDPWINVAQGRSGVDDPHRGLGSEQAER
jgi:hypothetical protein